MEHPPRCDKKEVDPTSLKSTLAELANSTLTQLWLNSPLREKIIIGRHSLENSGSGGVYHARYVNNKTGRFDGVHFYGQMGREDYTKSVKNIFMMAELNKISTNYKTEGGKAQSDNHVKCPQAIFQTKTKYHPSVQTKNRFDIFNQGN